MTAKVHWYPVRLDDSAVGAPLEQERMLYAISDAMVARATAATAQRLAGETA